MPLYENAWFFLTPSYRFFFQLARRRNLHLYGRYRKRQFQRRSSANVISIMPSQPHIVMRVRAITIATVLMHDELREIDEWECTRRASARADWWMDQAWAHLWEFRTHYHNNYSILGADQQRNACLLLAAWEYICVSSLESWRDISLAGAWRCSKVKTEPSNYFCTWWVKRAEIVCCIFTSNQWVNLYFCTAYFFRFK